MVSVSDFRLVQGNPMNKWIAPYIAYLVKKTNATLNSVYRGEDAASVLHKYGKHTQAEIHEQFPGGSNPPGISTHELRSDGTAYAGPKGRLLEWWQQGFDVNDSDVKRVIAEAKKHGWVVFQPYKRGVEFHHLNFKFEPKPQSVAMRAKLVRLRATLPKA